MRTGKREDWQEGGLAGGRTGQEDQGTLCLCMKMSSWAKCGRACL